VPIAVDVGSVGTYAPNVAALRPTYPTPAPSSSTRLSLIHVGSSCSTAKCILEVSPHSLPPAVPSVDGKMDRACERARIRYLEELCERVPGGPDISVL
jgi:hypothetical protein